MMRASAIGLLVALALATLNACAGSDAADSLVPDEQVPESDRYGGTLVIGIGADIDDVSPLTWNLRASSSLQQSVLFLPLISYDPDLQPMPHLARSWELSPDTSWLTFRLRDDVYWHDGVQSTAHDLQFSPGAHDAAEMAQAHLRRLGVDVRIEVLEFGTLLSQIAPGWHDFDGVIITWEPEFRIDDAPHFACSDAASPYNLTGYCDLATDGLLDSIARTLDPAVARALWSRYQHRLAAAQPVTLLNSRTSARRSGIECGTRSPTPAAPGSTSNGGGSTRRGGERLPPSSRPV